MKLVFIQFHRMSHLCRAKNNFTGTEPFGIRLVEDRKANSSRQWFVRVLWDRHQSRASSPCPGSPNRQYFSPGRMHQAVQILLQGWGGTCKRASDDDLREACWES